MTNAGAQRDMGKRWVRRRHITMCAFKSFFRDCPDDIRDICDQELTSLVRVLRQSSPGGHEPTKDITYFVARSMWRLIYGRGRLPDASTCERLRILSTKMDDYTKNSGPFSALDRFPMLKRFVAGSMTRYQDAVQFMNRFCDDCEVERRAHTGADQSHDLMTYMMRGARTLTTEDERSLGLNEDLLFSGVGDLIRAGTESPSLLLLWVCLMLAKYEDVQRKMYEELEYLRDSEADIPTICEASADRMPYSHAVVYETIRYCSIVPFLKRRCLSDAIVGGHRLPAGTNIIINNYAISHDPRRWHDPEVFRPERFLDQDRMFDASQLEQFLPFGIGKRRCMGEEIGKLLPFAAIATLVLNFRLSAPDPIDLSPSFGITLTPKKQPLVFTPRSPGSKQPESNS
ncbi:hypothetical protein LSH36_727g01039 [Paralvinella palmiformis]|uniref:unspecific monooxygenase n=1 Tax=Paralvinella palmiformis TaxID=53620 RepID=A0AAD9J1B0_9ANNE|nr:hypothetical protein LSH36_727g01039 [Paralvinella palmiformis]